MGSESGRMPDSPANWGDHDYIGGFQALDSDDEDILALARQQLDLEARTSFPLPPPITCFSQLQFLPEFLISALRKKGYLRPTPVQAQAVPTILAGFDLIGIARTGCGKTLAYVLPMIVHVEANQQPPPPTSDGNQHHPRYRDVVKLSPTGLVLAPTRELAEQIAHLANELLEDTWSNKGDGFWAARIIGGEDKEAQLRRARGASIIVGTPGRVIDLLDAKSLLLNSVSMFVLDEADTMLESGFLDDVLAISSHVHRERLMLFFSATWPKALEQLPRSLCRKSARLVELQVAQRGSGEVTTRPDIIQEVIVFEAASWEKNEAAKREQLFEHLRAVLKIAVSKVLVFVNTTALADEICTTLYEVGFTAASMHGKKKQAARMATLERFKQDEVRLLVCTDVLGRGIDIPGITNVVIYDMCTIEDYVHRIGRTARGLNCGRQGHALTFFEPNAKWPELPLQLVRVLESCQQPVPAELLRLAESRQGSSRSWDWWSSGAKRRKA